ncbi:AraC family transcriptional regulator [Mycolicibacterium fortuitum]|uniref:Helix-turn-helix domain-containing protein n=3 Tax=Mycobacteriaceae TaxID=1762 RepID=A0AAE4VCI2_MYCFO|nr:helix-turn-helix domain-containing protein [Mycolicibacterium fortuitum]MBP3086390.1 AraC family transcriptional regulator [Mycolicibacterium fortuitum]MCA4752416.1 AraC family transcriptional regulator [Mycolicibacterium fortuitum]MCV7141774.1 AraC family transcriptional regulator [Mycolicibacterium fortuitum]MDG5771551.1 helix-turn-helix domain-containing protein [Mycolicibacterium fortuitum]MDG5780919.1 helix-turn-helix domain-containing protein [Mycolicibacterium fortuitum]
MAAWKNAPMRGLVGRAGSASAFDLHRWAPSDEAAVFVEHFWSVTWDRREEGPFESTVITFPAMHLTHEWGDDVVRHGHPLPNTLLHGVVPKVFRITISGRGGVVGARFRPGGFVARFGGDAAAMTGRVVPVDDGLLDSPDLDRAIGAMPGEPDPTYGALCPLIDRMRDDDTLHRVEQVMSISPWSTRTTQRVFQRYVGVTVKWVLCRYRLQQAALEIEKEPGADFADLAVRLGWYDQAHFTNDFRSMLGSTPGEYAARHARPASPRLKQRAEG